MKKYALFLVFALLVSFTAGAQGINGSRNALGIRGGWGAELSYQRYVAPETRLEGTIGVNRFGFSFEGMYQLMHDIRADVNGKFKWYTGVGFGFGDWDDNDFDKGFSCGILGQAGIEYALPKSPIAFSFDYRPGLYFAPEFHFDWSGFAVAMRFYF